jgi:hypothetical protein
MARPENEKDRDPATTPDPPEPGSEQGIPTAVGRERLEDTLGNGTRVTAGTVTNSGDRPPQRTQRLSTAEPSQLRRMLE